MLYFWKFVIGFCFFSLGLIIFIWILKKRISGDKGGYASHIKLFVGSFGLIIIGFVMMFRELIKL